MKTYLYLVFGLMTLILSACSNDNPLYTKKGRAATEVLSISPLIESINVATTLQYQAYLLNDQGISTDVSDSVTWSTDDNSIAELSNNGLASGLSQGETIVTAEFNGLSSSASLTVTDLTLDSLQVTPAQSISLVGINTQFLSYALFTDGSNQDVTQNSLWTSADSSALIIDQGMVQAIQTNTPTGVSIDANFNGNSDSATLEIINANIEALLIDPPLQTLAKFERERYTAYLSLDNGEFIDVTSQVQWSVADSERAIISNNRNNTGELFALSPGTTDVQASLRFASNDLSATSALTVTPITLERIEIVPTDITVVRGTSGQYQATGFYNNGDQRAITKSVIWASSNPTIANIENSGPNAGQAYAIVPGTTIISASLDGVQASTSGTVISPNLDRIEVIPDTSEVPLGASESFRALAHFDDGSVDDITQQAVWQSDNTGIAETNFRVPGQANSVATGGPVNISATWQSNTDSAALMVGTAIPVKLSIQPGDSILPLRSNSPFKAFLSYSNNQSFNVTDQVTWSTQDTSLATVSNAIGNEGNVHTVKAGATTLSAAYDDGAFTDTETVSLTILGGYVTFIRSKCTPTQATVGDIISCTCTAILSSNLGDYDCKDLAHYSANPEGALNFSEKPGERNQAEAIAPANVNVHIQYGSSSTNSSLLIQ